MKLEILFVAAAMVACGDDNSMVGVDAPADVPPVGPWGTPQLLGIAPNPGLVVDDDPTMTGDLLELYFNRENDIYVATRASLTSAWSTPALVTELSSPDNDTTPEVSNDGLTMHFASDRPGGLGGTDIYKSTRASRTAAWGAPVAVAEASSNVDDAAPVITADGLTMVITSSRAGGTTSDVFISVRTSTSMPWGTFQAIDAVNTQAANEYSPFISSDGLSLYFDSNHGTGSDLYVATRTSQTAMFSSAQLITELNTTSEENDIWVSPDNRNAVFLSNRDGTYRYYESRR